jgi:hypothetical protein
MRPPFEPFQLCASPLPPPRRQGHGKQKEDEHCEFDNHVSPRSGNRTIASKRGFFILFKSRFGAESKHTAYPHRDRPIAEPPPCAAEGVIDGILDGGEGGETTRDQEVLEAGTRHAHCVGVQGRIPRRQACTRTSPDSARSVPSQAAAMGTAFASFDPAIAGCRVRSPPSRSDTNVWPQASTCPN